MLTDATSIDSPLHRLEQSAVRAAHWLLDLIYPPACGHCGRVDFRFCTGCLQELERVPVSVSWRPAELLDDLRATGQHSGLLQSAVHAFKYNGAPDLAMPLADRMVRALRHTAWRFDAVVPVPLFAEQEIERGYNQSNLLSQHLALKTGIPTRPDFLNRIRRTSQQAKLTGQERQENVKGAFAATPEVMELSLLLVDDVVTSGSTLRECAKALRQQGAGHVAGIAVSHSLSSDWILQEEYDEYQHSWRWD